MCASRETTEIAAGDSGRPAPLIMRLEVDENMTLRQLFNEERGKIEGWKPNKDEPLEGLKNFKEGTYWGAYTILNELLLKIERLHQNGQLEIE